MYMFDNHLFNVNIVFTCNQDIERNMVWDFNDWYYSLLLFQL